MNDQNAKSMLEKAFPPLPLIVKSRICDTVVNGDAGKGIRMHRVIPRIIWAVLLLLILGAATVAALNNMGVLHFTQSYKSESCYYTLPQASELVQKDLAVIERPDVIVRVEEAAYDGRTLQVMYSITRRNAPAAFDPQAAENGEYAYDSQANGNMGGCDWLVVNGIHVELIMSATSAGDEKGQLLYYVESNLEPPGDAKLLRPTGKMTVGLPIQSGGDKPIVPEGLTFTMDAGDAAARYSLKLPEPVELRGCRLQFTDLHFSPIQVSIHYTITIPQEIAVGKSESELDPLIRSFAYSRLKNDQGERLGSGKDGGYMKGPTVADNGDLVVEVYDRYTPSGQYTKVVYLSTEGGDKIPIPMEPAGM